MLVLHLGPSFMGKPHDQIIAMTERTPYKNTDNDENNRRWCRFLFNWLGALSLVISYFRSLPSAKINNNHCYPVRRENVFVWTLPLIINVSLGGSVVHGRVSATYARMLHWCLMYVILWSVCICFFLYIYSLSVNFCFRSQIVTS